MRQWLFNLLVNMFDRTADCSSQFRKAVSAAALMITVFLPGGLLAGVVQANANTPNGSQANQISKTFSGFSGEGSLGVYVGDVNEERARELKLAEVRGALIGKVEEASPAATAGLLENDVILTFNEQKIFNPTHLYRFLTATAPGETVTLSVSRNGSLQTIKVQLGRRPASQKSETQRLFSDADAMLRAAEDRVKQAEEARQRGDEKEVARLLEEEKEFRRGSAENRAAVERDLREGKIQPDTSRRFGYNLMAARHQLGVRVIGLTEQLAGFFNVKDGVLVSELAAGGIAESAGIKVGDCIVAVNNDRVASSPDLNRLIDRAGREVKDGGEVTLTIVRDRKEQTIKVTFGQR